MGLIGAVKGTEIALAKLFSELCVQQKTRYGSNV